MKKPALVFMCTVLLVLQHCQLITSSSTNTAAATTTEAATTTDPTVTTTIAATTDPTATTLAATATTTTGPTTTAGSGTTGTGSTAAATGSTTAVTVECFDGNCTGSGCLVNVPNVCQVAAGGSCKLVEDASGADPVYVMSCHASLCVYAVHNKKIKENCCLPAQCNNDVNILKASAPSLVGAWSIVLPCLYMLAV